MRVMLILLILLPAWCKAQKVNGFYANVKAGVNNFVSNDEGVALSLEGGLVTAKNLYSLSYLRTEEILGRDLINSVDFTIGRFTRKQNFIFHYQAGLGAVWGQNDKDDSDFTTIGLPLKTGIKFVPSNFFSVGIDAQANFNFEVNTYQVMLTLGVWPKTWSD